jgi:hypothetical protein
VCIVLIFKSNRGSKESQISFLPGDSGPNTKKCSASDGENGL